MEVSEGAKVEVKQIEQSASKGEVKSQEIDKGTVVTERETTTVTTRDGSKGSVTIKRGDLKPGENVLPMDSAVGLIKAVLDTLNKTLTISIDQPAERTETIVKERITEQRDYSKQSEERTQDTTKKQVAIAAEQHRREESMESASESKPTVKGMLWFWIGGGVFVVIVGIAIALWVNNFSKKMRK
ncbi:hypothetical protein [Sphingobacteruim zhuxiongii]|nr:hypothetical protein [Sphingobacterium sp. DK4209]